MSTATRLTKLAEGLDSNGVLSAAKGGTGNTTGGGTTSPTISQIAYLGNDTATDPAGGGLITLTGTNFASGAKVLINTTQVSVVTVVSTTQITFTAPQLAAGSYILYVVNLDGSTAIAVPGLQVSGVPAWTTAADTLGTTYETAAISTTVTATSNSAVTYSVFSGTLPTGATLASNGTISGTSVLTNSSTTYTFTIRATDAENQDTDRSFSLTINPDVVSWSSPANGAALTGAPGVAYSSALVATSAVGQTVSYSANSLPAGLAISGATITGTPTTAGSSSTTLTATAAVTNRSAQVTISWTIVVAGDAYFPYTTLLLNSETTATPFTADASTNNFAVTINGDTRPNNINPYQAGYYSNFFDGTGDYLDTPSSTALAFGTGDWEYSFWYNAISASGYLFDTRTGSATGLTVYYASGAYSVYVNSSTAITGTDTAKNTWHYVTLSKVSGSTRLFVDGTQIGSTYTDANNYVSGTIRLGCRFTTITDIPFNGWISNFKVVKGTGVTTQTVPTVPATLTTNTQLLTCQSNRFIDNSLNNLTITKSGDTTVSGFIPFVTPTSVSVNNLYSTYFDGTGDSIYSSVSAAGTGSFTYEAWVYPLAFASNKTIFRTNSVGALDISLLCNSTGQLLSYDNSGTLLASTTTTLQLNTWTQVALVRNGTAIEVYINGAASRTGGTGTFSNNITFTQLDIGGRGDGAEVWNGYISNARYTKSAVYTGAFTPATSNLTAITNTSLLTCQDATLKDNSSNTFTITSTGDARPVAQSPFTQTTTVVPLTTVGSAYFDGTGDYLTFPITASNQLSGDFTVEFWSYFIARGTNGSGLINNYNNSTTGAFGIFAGHVSVDTTKYQFAYNGGAFPAISSTVTIKYNQWAHIAVVRSGTIITLYIDGVAQGTLSSAGATLNGVGSNWYVGAAGDAIANYSSTGYTSNLRIIKGTALYTANFAPPVSQLTAVTNTQLLTLQTNQPAANKQFVDNSTNNFLITQAGNATQGTFSPYGANWSNYFGSGNYVSAASNSAFALGTGDFTVEAWVYPTSAYTTYNYVLGVAVTDGLVFYVTGGNLVVRAYGTGDLLSSSTIPALNAWTHIAATRSGTTLRIFVNGVQTASTTNSTNFAQGSAVVGNDGTNAAPWYGYISNLRLVKGTAVYTSAFTPPTTPLTAIANTQLLTCQNSRFVDNSSNAFALTVNGAPSVQRFSPFSPVTQTPQTYSGFFDGTGDYLTAPSNAIFGITGSWSVEVMLYVTGGPSQNYPTGDYADYVVDFRSGDTLNAYLGIAKNASGNIVLWGGMSGVDNLGTTTLSLNTWYYLAYVYNGTTLKGYLNGSQELSQTVTRNMGTNSPTIGARYNRTEGYIQGYLSNFRLVTSAITPSTPTSPLTAITNTKLLTCQSPTFIDNSTNAFAITAVGNTIPRAFNPFGYTNTTGQAYTPALYGGSAYFDGNGDYLTAPYSTSLVFGTNDFTVECWMYLTDSSVNARRLFALGDGANGGGTVVYETWELRYYGTENSGQVGIVRYDGTVYEYVTTGASVTANAWYHIAASRTGGTLKIFVNGIAYYSAANALNFSAVNSNSFYVALGYYGPASGYSGPRYFPGYISNIRVIKGTAVYTSNFVPPSAPLTATAGTTLLLNMDKAAIADKSGKVLLETVGDAKISTVQSKFGGSSMAFDGTGDYLSIPSSPNLNFGTGDFTIECWAYFNSLTSIPQLFNKHNGTSGWFLEAGSNTLYFGYSAANSSQYYQASGFTLTTSTWYHIAATRVGSTLSIFLNGVKYSSTVTGAGSSYDNTAPVLIGVWSSSGYELNGYIDDLRITKGVARYTANFTPPTATLIAK